MKNLVVILSIVLLAVACKKQGCSDTYTISGRLFHDQNGFFEKDEPLKNWEVSFNVSIPRNFAVNKAEHLGTAITDDNGNFSFTYTCREAAERVGMGIAKSGSIIPGTSYYLPPNQNIHRDFTETSHARIVFQIDNKSDLDTLHLITGLGNVFDSGNIDGILKGENPVFLAVPIKGKSSLSFGAISSLDNSIFEESSRKNTYSYGKSYEALIKKDYLGRVSIQCQGAPYYDTVRIELR